MSRRGAAMVLMTAECHGDTLPPLGLVSLVVLASLLAARRYIGGAYRT